MSQDLHMPMESRTVLNLDRGATQGAVEMELLDSAARFNLRVSVKHIEGIAQCIGSKIPLTIGQCETSENGQVICLGPDEWLLLTSEENGRNWAKSCSSLSAKVPHSITDISDREVTIGLKGTAVIELLSVGCPIDLEKMKDNVSRRSVFDGVQIVLHRCAFDHFRVDVWRSFLPHVWSLLNLANLELAAEEN